MRELVCVAPTANAYVAESDDFQERWQSEPLIDRALPSGGAGPGMPFAR